MKNHLIRHGRKFNQAVFLAGLAIPFGALATPSGLNNIPTADTAPNLTPVIQGYTTFGEQRLPDYSVGMKMGLGPWTNTLPWNSRFEWGVDGHLTPGEAGPAVFQAKYALQPWAKLPALGIGSANLALTSSDRSRAGQPFSYAVLTEDLGWFRLHGGYGLQAEHNNTALLGIDKTFTVFDHALTLRSDAIQINQQHDWEASVGGMYEFCRWFTVETWANFPTGPGKPSFVVKFDIPLDFRRK